MNVPRFAFLILVGMCVTLGVAAYLPAPEGGHVAAHPDYGSMTRTVSGPDSTRLQIVGGVFGGLQIGFFVCCIAWGIQRGAQDGVRVLISVGSVFYLASMVLLVAAHLYYGGNSDPETWWGFPRPTAVMLFLVWPVPIWFVILYVVKFDSWIVGPDVEEKVRDLAESRRRREGAN